MAEAVLAEAENQLTQLDKDGKSPGTKYSHWIFLLTSMLCIALTFMLAGFFFLVCGGHSWADILLIHRDWVEVPATITNVRQEGFGRGAATVYSFTYQLGDQKHSAECYGPQTWKREGEVRARYDRNNPDVAVLVGGMRAKSFPFLAMLLSGVLLLVVFLAPMILGHTVATAWSFVADKLS